MRKFDAWLEKLDKDIYVWKHKLSLLSVLSYILDWIVYL